MASYPVPAGESRAEIRDKGSRFLELPGPCSLCKVARDGHQVRLDLSNGLYERLDNERINAAKVDVGEMYEAAHLEQSLLRDFPGD